jgi:hypothetical protein
MEIKQTYTVYTIETGKPDTIQEFDNKHEAISTAISELVSSDGDTGLQTRMDAEGNYIFINYNAVKFVEKSA